jgi:hypothetical protein
MSVSRQECSTVFILELVHYDLYFVQVFLWAFPLQLFRQWKVFCGPKLPVEG